jgi:hypothetical protein
MSEPLILRQSTIGSMQLCPARVGLSVVDGFNSTPSEAMFFGSLVHNLIERFLGGYVAGGVTPPSTYPLELLSRSVIGLAIADVCEKDGFDWEDVTRQEQREAIYEEARVATLAWFAQVWSAHLFQSDVLGVEQKLTAPLRDEPLPSGRQALLQGTPDLWTGGTVIDWKTSGRAWVVHADLTKGHFSPQAPIYFTLIERNGGPKIRRMTFYVYDRSSASWAEHETNWTDEQVEASLENAWQYAKQIDAGAFPYTPFESTFGKYKRGWHCSPKYCGAWDICPGKAMIADDTDLSVRTERSW